MKSRLQAGNGKAQKRPKNKVFVGLSGGVDSAVSAALLKSQGYDVTGFFIKAWTPEWLECTWKEDRRSAMRVAAVLDIPFFTLDLEKEYKEGVVDYMISEYCAGRTPNPDVMCNKEIKFGAFMKWAMAKGANFVATGHYARTLPFGEGREGLLEAKDKNKDQSYFLWTLTPDQLKHILFPVGNLLKPEVRKLAKKFNLPQATRKDSQGLCFLGQVDMKEFLARYIDEKRGNVLNMEGEVIGYHNGALFFTLGERHGFTITKKTSEDAPMYVVAKDVEKNILTVAKKNFSQKVLGSPLLHEARLSSKNFSSLPDHKITCRFRYRQEKIPCKVVGDKVIFDSPQEPISPGQSIVFYDGEICLGGAVISPS